MSRVFTSVLASFAVSSCVHGPGATVDGAAIHWESSGNGPALVFIHGVERDSTDWEYQVAEFEDDYRVITLDLPGHGQSGSLSDVVDSSVPGGGSLIPLAEAVEAVRAEAGIDQMVLVGHSLGGWVVGEYMMHHPQYVVAIIAGDIDIHGPPAGQAPEWEKTLTYEDSIDVPTLFVFGDNSALLGINQRFQREYMPRLYPRAMVEMMSDVGHDVQLENPSEFNRLMREFLDEIDY